MRLAIPGGQWVDLRGPDELTGADDDAFQRVYSAAFAQDVEITDEDDQMEVSPDGVSMTPKAKPKRTIRVTMDMVAEQRDILLSRLITAWSFDIPLPYNSASRELLPLAATRALNEAIKPHLAELRKSAGPKESPGTTPASSNGSKAPSASPQTA